MPCPANELGAIVPFVASQKVKRRNTYVGRFAGCCGYGCSAFGHGMPCPYCRNGNSEGKNAVVIYAKYQRSRCVPTLAQASFSRSRLSGNACATQQPRVALLFGAVSRHLPASIARIARFAIALSSVLILVLPAVRTASFAADDKPVLKVQSFAELAQQLAANLNKCGVKRIMIVDFEDPIKRTDAFGEWLADQLAAAPGNPWTPIEVVDRKQIAAKWEQLRIAEPYTIEPDRRLHMAKAFDATLIEGSYSPAENGIGLELSAAPTGMSNALIVKLAMTDEMKAHLTKPLESLGPGDGVFTAGAGGVSIPACMYCPNPSFETRELNGQPHGTVLLMIVIDSSGRASDVTVTKELGPELDQDAINAVKRWKFKPATDVDGKPVAVRTSVEIDFRVR